MSTRQDDFLKRLESGLGIVRAAVDPTQGRGIWGFGRDLVQEAQRRPLTTLTPLGAPEGYRAGTQLKEDGHPILGTGLQMLSIADGLAGGISAGLLGRQGLRGLRAMGQSGHVVNPRVAGLPRPPEPSGRTVPAHHYSRSIDDPSISHLDPSKAGTGRPGAEMNRDRRATNFYFPREPGQGPRPPEPQFQGDSLYEFEFPEESILTDKEAIGAFHTRAMELLQTGEADGYAADVMEDLMEQAGYRGWQSNGMGRVFGHTEIPGRFNARVLRDAKANDGITIDPRTGEDLGGQDLYSVAVHKGDDMEIFGDLTEEHIAQFRRDFAEDLAKPGHQIGGWRDAKTNRWVLDVAETYPDRAAAEAAGRGRGQDAIFHLGTFEEIPLKKPPSGGGSGGPGGAPSINTRGARPEELRGVMDPDAEKIQGTVDDGFGYDPEVTGFTGQPSELTQAVARSRTVPALLDEDFERGLELMGGLGPHWYELGPSREAIEGLGAHYNFDQFNLIGGATSAQTPVPLEIASTAAAMFGLKRGLSMPQVRELYRQMVGPGPKNLYLNENSYNNARRFLDEGAAAQTDPNGPGLKIPSYVAARQGGGAGPLASPALDTHERRRIWQAVQANPALRRLADRTLSDSQRAAGTMPIRNAADYQLLSGIYRRQAGKHGLLTPAQYQAPRWVGGGEFTGLRTAPTNTFNEIFADVLHATARDRGMDTSPKGLQSLLRRVMNGDEFLLPYYSPKSLARHR